MDYEKKYKEALKKAEAFYYSATTEPITEREVLANIFPELKESEDEKIKKDVKRAISVALDYSYFDKETANNCLAWIEKQGEQKLVFAWSEEDKKYLRRAINATRNGYPETNNWLKSLKDRVQLQQKPVWSEDDERMRQYVVSDLRLLNELAHDSNYAINVQLIEKEIDWLKSLKERYTWKPSDEQMEVLKVLVDTSKGFDHSKILESLYNDLKKLREG